MTHPRRNPIRRRLDQEHGKHYVDARCRCGRRWFLLGGYAGELTDVEYVKHMPGAAGISGRPDSEPNWYDPWKMKITPVGPQVTIDLARPPLTDENFERMAEDLTYQVTAGPQRFRVRCHRKCGRTNEVITWERLADAFAAAATAGHADVTL